MTTLADPLRFEPYLRPMVWGGRRLERLGKQLPEQGLTYGESWDVSDHPSHRSVVAEGPWVGRSLRDLMASHAGDLLGPAAERFQVFPWLIKFLDCQNWLSVQVHPDEAKARIFAPSEGPKNEAWFVVSADSDAGIIAGLKPGVDEVRLRAALATGEVADCLHRFRPHPGDCLYLHAGVVHTVGGGVLMAEIQQTSDATFRLHDWGRRDAQGHARALHVEESMACIDWTAGPQTPVHAPEFGAAAATSLSRPLVRCPFFHCDYLEEPRDFTLGGAGVLQALIVLGGSGEWETGEVICTGQVWLLPAAMPGRRCRMTATLKAVLATLP